MQLHYNSNGGNGMLGMGWSLTGLGAVTRYTGGGIRYDASDRFIGPDGVLVASSGGFRGRENGSTLYQLQGNPANPDGFIALSADKTKYYYGMTPDSRISSTRGAYAWALSKVEDVNGRSYTIEYLQDQGAWYVQKISSYSDIGENILVILNYTERPD
ncbi:MAG: hypothetical protein D6722_12105, partial [Bacteroidetes bacterium]